MYAWLSETWSLIASREVVQVGVTLSDFGQPKQLEVRGDRSGGLISLAMEPSEM